MTEATAESNDRQASSETRKRILAAAEKLFSKNGLDATSVRDITTEADCNVASVNYHFGGKDALYRETFRSLLLEINERRIGAIQRTMTANPNISLEEFLEAFANAFMEPIIDASRGRLFTSFFAREMIDPRLPPEIIVDEFIRPFMAVSIDAMKQVGPAMADPDRLMCLMSLIGQLVQLHHAERLFRDSRRGHGVPITLEDQIRHIVRFSAGGMHACASPNSAREHDEVHGDQ
ncbi:MAG: TetR/AcrR family transcriptional regulator [bacterium]|nr:TetR/AcrR family transcriptional regulator [bacterium]